MDRHHIAQPFDEVDASQQDNGQLSPNSEKNLDLVKEKLKSGEVIFSKDDDGNPILVYPNRNFSLSYVDKSQSNLIAVPKTEKDAQNRMEACLEMINFMKNNKSPQGVVFDNKKVQPKYGKYREGEEYSKLNEVLGSGTMAGNIVVVKDNTTGSENAQKTVMMSEFREEEVRAWVDLGGDGFSPTLYSFRVEGNRVVFDMEKLERAITLRDVIDSHMEKLHQQAPDLVRPFSLHIFHGLLSAVKHMHDKNWTHRDLHAGNVMIQAIDDKLQLKVLDFGKANKLQGGDCYDLSGEQDDIYQVVRLFTAIYLGQEFDSAKDLKDNYAQLFYKLDMDGKTEVFQVIDAAMNVAKSAEMNLTDSQREKLVDDALDQIKDKVGDSNEVDDMMKRVAAILFNEEDYISLHGEKLDQGDGVDGYDASVDLEKKASHVPDEFIQKRRLGLQCRRHN